MYKIHLLITILCLFAITFSTHAEETKGMLEAHNQERAKHDLSPLSWSPSLVNYAQQWANHLAQTNQCNMQHRPQSGVFKQNYGENLYWASPIKWSNVKVEVQNIDGSKVVQDWASEKQYYNIRINQCFTGRQCGHYTQIVWKTTTQVGCAKAICGDKSQVWVCNYNPPGNYIGQRPY